MKPLFLRCERFLTELALRCAGLMLLLAASLGMYQVLARFVLHQPAPWSEVSIRLLLVWTVFLAIPAAFRAGAMVSVDLLRRKVSSSLRPYLEGVIALASVVLLAYIAWYGWNFAQRGKVQTIIGLEFISMFWAYVALPVGCVFAIIGVIGNFLDPRNEELESAQ